MDAAWAQVYAAWAQVFVGLLQCELIAYGLRAMNKASDTRNRQLDQQGKALEDIGLGINQGTVAADAAAKLTPPPWLGDRLPQQERKGRHMGRSLGASLDDRKRWGSYRVA